MDTNTKRPSLQCQLSLTNLIFLSDIIRCNTASWKSEFFSCGERCKLWEEYFFINMFFLLPFFFLLSLSLSIFAILSLLYQSWDHVCRTKMWILKKCLVSYTFRQWLHPTVHYLININISRHSGRAGKYYSNPLVLYIYSYLGINEYF